MVPGGMEASWWVLFYRGPSAPMGNSAFRFCLLLQWHAISVPSTALFPASRQEEVSDVESVGTVSESNQAFLERSLLAAVATRTPVSPGLVRQGHSKMRHSRVGKSAAVPLTHSRPRPFCALAGNSNTGRHPY